MKRPFQSILILALSTLTLSVHASTNVPPSISTDTQWDASGNPYLIQGKTTVAKGATLHIGPNVQVVFQGNSAMEINGTLNVEGSAAAPAVFRMTEGGLQSELYINGGEALMTNVRVLSGVFLVQDSQLHLQWFEITKGSGLYLRGSTTANVKNGKIYGNATGVVLDGPVKATFEFDTITQNTYGLFLKNFSDLDFTNNSVHDNDKEVLNNTPEVNLQGNYWGNSDEKTVQAKIQGKATLSPMKTLKDVLRVYIRTQLPVINKQMETALKAKEKKEKETLAQKSAPAASTSVPATAPVAESPAPPSAEAAPEEVPAATPEVVETAPAPSGEGTESKVAKIKELPPAPHKLKPPAYLPPDQGNVAEAPAAVPPASDMTQPEPSAPAVAAPAPAPAAPEASTPPAPAGSDMSLPPPPAGENSTVTTAPSAPPVPAEVSGSSNSTNAPPVPPSADVIAPPNIETAPASPSAANPSPSTAPPPPPVPVENVNSSTPAANNEPVPAPPDLGEQIPPAAANPAPSTNSTAPPAPPSVPAEAIAAPPAPPAAPAPANTPAVNAEDQQKALKSLDGVSGDIDGMQAPPLDLGPDLSTPSNNSGTTENKSQNTQPQSSKPNDSSLALPPLKDADVAPPKDLDLPPTDDLGNVTLDSKK